MTAQTLSLQQLTAKVERLERQVTDLKQALDQLRQRSPDAQSTSLAHPPYMVPKEVLRERVSALWADSSPGSGYIDIEALQQQTAEAGLAPNEISRTLVAARDE